MFLVKVKIVHPAEKAGFFYRKFRKKMAKKVAFPCLIRYSNSNIGKEGFHYG